MMMKSAMDNVGDSRVVLHDDVHSPCFETIVFHFVVSPICILTQLSQSTGGVFHFPDTWECFDL